MAVAETGEKPFNNRTPPRAGAETSSRKPLPWPRRRLEARDACQSFPPRIVPGTTRRHANASTTALQRPRSPKRVVLAPRSQTAAFEPPRRRARHRRTSPAAAVLPRLVTTFALPLTSLSSTVPKSAAVRPGSRQVAVSVRKGRFRGVEYRSAPLPASSRCLRFGTVFGKAYWQALSGLSWLSFSRPTIYAGPRACQTRAPPSRCDALPTPERLRGPSPDPRPLCGIFTRFASSRLPSRRGGTRCRSSLPAHAEVFPCRPGSGSEGAGVSPRAAWAPESNGLLSPPRSYTFIG
jgi:hypothetical protein